MKRAVAAGAGRVVLAADPTKLGGGGTAVGLEWDQVDVLVTELAPTDDRLTPYRNLADIL